MQIERLAIGLVTVVIAVLLGYTIFTAENRDQYPTGEEPAGSASLDGTVSADGRGGREIVFDDARQWRYRSEDNVVDTKGASRAADAAANEGSAVATRTTQVGPDETFSHISRRVYGSASYWKVLVSANPEIDPRKMRAGQTVRVPALPNRGDQGAATTRNASTTETLAAGARTHRVEARETFRGLAKRYYEDAERWQEIFEANRDKVKSPRSLVEGTVLLIP